ncbi:MAG: mechanosensitive ion channel family protein [Leptolyngbyaceae cyanobacterium]
MQHFWKSRAIALILGCLLALSLPALAQDTAGSDADLLAVPATQPTQSSSDNEVYFSDVIVRGRPIFQVGGLSNLSASARAAVINRRIASLLTNTENPAPITVEPSPSGNWATLRLNNRVIMTVTQQDGEDFGLAEEALAEKWATELNQAFDKPPLFIDVAQRLDGTVRQLSRTSLDKLPALLGALIVVLLTWAIAAIVRYAAFTWAQQTEGDRSTEILIGRLGYGAVWIFGTVVALGVLGLDFGALLGAFGLTSVAIGFSLKDVLSNYISGVVLLAARPFRLGDQVVIDEYEGTITQIQLRATTLQTYDGRTVYIPNQEVFQASITNNTASPHRRSSITVGVDYDADLTETKTVILRSVTQVKGISKDSPIDVLIQELAASTVNLEVRFWVDSRRRNFLDTTSDAAQSIKEALQQAHVEMPTEIYTLQFRNSASVEVSSAGLDFDAAKSSENGV